jgi:hypothetical protein
LEDAERLKKKQMEMQQHHQYFQNKALAKNMSKPALNINHHLL